MAKNINRVPLTVPGAGMAEVVRRTVQWRKSASLAYTDPTGATNLFEIPGNVLVTNALIRVTTAFDASGASAAATLIITVPNDTGTETIFDASATGLQTTGYFPATNYALTPASGGYVIATYTAGGTNVHGALEVYLEYVQNENLL